LERANREIFEEYQLQLLGILSTELLEARALRNRTQLQAVELIGDKFVSASKHFSGCKGRGSKPEASL
jgi:hypothetical protein